jgi:hypothetical protein
MKQSWGDIKMQFRRVIVPVIVSGALVLFGSGFAFASGPFESTGLASPPPAGVVGYTPADTPQLSTTGSVEQIRQLVQCGGTMYAVGTFTSIKKGTTVYAVNNAFSFSATAPYAVTSWAPDIVGSSTSSSGVVNSIAFNGDNCADAYIGGDFTSVNGTKVTDIAEISTSTGDVVSAFGHSASASVQTLLGVDGHILAGGYYKTINGSSADPYMTSLNPVTGKDDGFVQLNISGNYQFTCQAGSPGCPSNGEVASNATRVYNQSLSHGGTLDLVMGDFTSVGGVPRQQIFMLNLATSPATVTAWSRSTFRPRPGHRMTQRSTSGPLVITRTAGRSARRRAPGCVMPPPHSRQLRKRSTVYGSITSAVIRCIQQRLMPTRPISAAMSGSQ